MHHNNSRIATAVMLLIISSIEQLTAFIATGSTVDNNTLKTLPVQLAQSTISPIRKRRIKHTQIAKY